MKKDSPPLLVLVPIVEKYIHYLVLRKQAGLPEKMVKDLIFLLRENDQFGMETGLRYNLQVFIAHQYWKYYIVYPVIDKRVNKKKEGKTNISQKCSPQIHI